MQNPILNSELPAQARAMLDREHPGEGIVVSLASDISQHRNVNIQ